MTNIFLDLFKGFIYGIFSITPGLSGGALAFKLGDYNKCINIINKRDINISNILYLAVLFIGFMIGSIIFSRVILKIYYMFKLHLKLLVIIVNLKILKDLIKNIDNKKKLLIKCFLLTIFLLFVFRNFNYNINANTLFIYLLCGIIFSISKIIPGLSATPIFININFYDNLLLFFANPIKAYLGNIFYWNIFIIAFIITAITVIKIITKYIDVIKKIVIFILIYNIFELII